MTAEAVAEALKHYPLRVELEGTRFTVRKAKPEDGPLLREFVSGLPPHDLLYLRRDITKQEGIDRWTEDVRRGAIHTLLGEDEEGIAGYSMIHRSDLDWSRHVADLRVTAAPRARRQGLGRLLAREAFNIALVLGIEKVVARMTPDQLGARALFEELGFQPEALLKDEVRDRAGEYHDLLIMAVDVETFLSQRHAFGVQV